MPDKIIEPKILGFEWIEWEKLKWLQGELKEINNSQFEKLQNSIVNRGFKDVFHIWKNGDMWILDGHHRQKALLNLIEKGYTVPKKLPAVIVDIKNKKDAIETVLQYATEYAHITYEGLYQVHNENKLDFESMKMDFELPKVNWDKYEEGYLKDKYQSGGKDDDIPKEPEPISKQGDMFVFDNKHRLLCGDCTIKENIELLMNGQKTDMVFTDPPYGIFLNTDFSSMIGIAQGNEYKKVIGDNEDFKPELITTVFDNFKCKEIFLWGFDYYTELIKERNKGSVVVWDKMQGGEGVNDDYDKMFGSNFELCWSKTKHKRAIARVLWKGIFGLGKEDTDGRVHPTQKPVELCVWFLDKYSKDDNIIVDIYLGSGSTLIACERTNRICYGMEIDPYYCDVIIQRYKDLTGKDVKKIT